MVKKKVIIKSLTAIYDKVKLGFISNNAIKRIFENTN